MIEIGVQAVFANNHFSNEANQSQGFLILQLILQVFNKNLFKTKNKSLFCGFEIFFYLLLLFLSLDCKKSHSKLLSEEQKSIIITKTLERGYQNIQKDFLRCQLNEIFLSFFLSDFNFINNFLINTAQYEAVIQSILEKIEIYQHNYDRKVKKLKKFNKSSIKKRFLFSE